MLIEYVALQGWCHQPVSPKVLLSLQKSPKVDQLLWNVSYIKLAHNKWVYKFHLPM